MGLLGLFKGKEQAAPAAIQFPAALGAAAKGEYVPMEKIPDEMFSQGIMGDLLLTMDLDKIHAAGHAATVIMAVTNSDDFSSVDETGSGSVQPGDGVLLVVK